MTVTALQKFDGGVTGQSTTSTPWKFDAVCQRNSTVPGSRVRRCVLAFIVSGYCTLVSCLV